MVDLIGKVCCDDTGMVMGVYAAIYYRKMLSKCSTADFHPWDKKYPDWLNKPVLVVCFKEPQYAATKAEVADWCGVDESVVSDKMMDILAGKRYDLAMPYDAVFPADGGEADGLLADTQV